MRSGSLLPICLVTLAAAVFACNKDKEATQSPDGGDAVASTDDDTAMNPAKQCEGNCVIDYSPMDLGMGIDDSAVSKAVSACEAEHSGDDRCVADKWTSGKHMAICQVCKKEVDVEGDQYDITLEYSAKFGYVYWVFRSPSRDGMETIHWVGAHDGVYKGPWTLEAGSNP